MENAIALKCHLFELPSQGWEGQFEESVWISEKFHYGNILKQRNTCFQVHKQWDVNRVFFK